MAIIAATLSVEFTTNHPGNHRVCYREAGETDYTCVTADSCVAGDPCSKDIEITVDDEGSTQTYEGYVQSTCETELSTEGRVEFSAVYEP
jgi:hypothetical protein